jgi:succinate-acetate transporter protein
MSTITPEATQVSKGAHLADPGPLGLAAFALTTFVLSCANAGLFKAEPVVLGLALFYGGIAQVLAGMWEFAKGNTFGATAFTSYGAFWMSFWFLASKTDLTGFGGDQAQHGVGVWLLAWTIFTAYMLVAVIPTGNVHLIAVFGALTATFVFLALGDLTTTENLGKVGGYLGILTAALAWFTSFTGVSASTRK